MQEDGAAASGNAGTGVVIDLDDEIVEVIVPRQPVAAITRRARHGLIVMPVSRVFRPGVRRPDGPDRQMRSWPWVPVGSPP